MPGHSPCSPRARSVSRDRRDPRTPHTAHQRDGARTRHRRLRSRGSHRARRPGPRLHRRSRPGPRAHRRRRHRVLGQDVDEGPACRGARTARAGRRAAGSFNNELGHPWTALRADEQTRYLVLELSARGRGHIAALAEVAPPRIGVVLNVGTAHLGEFGRARRSPTAKGELVEALPSAYDGGVAVLNADDSLVAAMAERTKARAVTVGMSAQADIRAVDVVLDDERPRPVHAAHPCGRGARSRSRCTASIRSGTRSPPPRSRSSVGSSLDAGGRTRCPGRGRHRHVAHGGRATRDDGVTVINDSYNANPDSMRAGAQGARVDGAGGRFPAAQLGGAR